VTIQSRPRRFSGAAEAAAEPPASWHQERRGIIPPPLLFRVCLTVEPEKEPNVDDARVVARSTSACIQTREPRRPANWVTSAESIPSATIPHSNWDPVTEYERQNGNSPPVREGVQSIGLPYGSLPRLLLIWMSTEVVFTAEPRSSLART